MRWVADCLYLMAAVIYLPVLAYQMVVQRKNRSGWRERLGLVALTPPVVGQRRIWLHAVSLGEVNATPLLVRRLRERVPGADIVVSTTTDTGYARACQLYGRERVFRFPLDFSIVIARTLDRVAPSLIVLTELEVWYNLVRMASQRGIAVAVVNGRLTERSRRRFRWVAPLVRSMFERLAWVGAQDEPIGHRFKELGVPADRVAVTGSIKWDSAQLAKRVDGDEELATSLGLDGARPIWVCGSTGPGEEAIILDAYRRLAPDSVQLVIAPRKPERFDEVARLIEARGYTCVRRSHSVQDCGHGVPRLQAVAAARHRGAEQTASSGLRTQDSGLVFLGDTIGELRKFYSLATVVFVGRSLVPMGGSDPMEVAALGKPIVTGPFTENFRQPIDSLAAAGVVQRVVNAEELSAAVNRLIRDPGAARELGVRAREVVRAAQGATQSSVDALCRLIQWPAV